METNTERAVSALTIKEVFVTTFDLLKEMSKGILLPLPRPAASEVGDDSDGHRTKKGYMEYKNILLIEKEEKKWVVGLGFPCGYPADPFKCDIVVIQIDSGKSPEVQFKERVWEEGYFKNTIFVGMRDGSFGTGRRVRVEGAIVERFIVGEPVHDDTLITLNLATVVSKQGTYTTEFPVFLAENIYNNVLV